MIQFHYSKYRHLIRSLHEHQQKRNCLFIFLLQKRAIEKQELPVEEWDPNPAINKVASLNIVKSRSGQFYNNFRQQGFKQIPKVMMIFASTQLTFTPTVMLVRLGRLSKQYERCWPIMRTLIMKTKMTIIKVMIPMMWYNDMIIKTKAFAYHCTERRCIHWVGVMIVTNSHDFITNDYWHQYWLFR